VSTDFPMGLVLLDLESVVVQAYATYTQTQKIYLVK